MSALRVGIFDSGVGGLSVLRALHPWMAGATLHYVADSRHAPYGDRDEAFIVERSMRLGWYLVDAGAQVLVVACNTATAAAVASLRETFDGLPIVGVEPGIKPAVAASRNGRIGVMATGATLRSARLRALVEAHAGNAHVHLQACHGLAAAIETGALEAPALRELVERHAAPLREADVDTVVLGCTHYPFVRHLVESALGANVRIIDTAEAVARRTVDVCAGLHSSGGSAGAVEVLLQTTGDADPLRRIAEPWLPFSCTVTAAPAGL